MPAKKNSDYTVSTTEPDNSDRRNAKPSDVHVRPNADFYHLESLDKKDLALVENRYEVFIHNVEYLIQSHGITQARMCNDYLDGYPLPSQMAAFKRRGKDIPYRVIARVAAAFGYTPEQLCGTLLDSTESSTRDVARPHDEYTKYVGNYHMCYFASDAKLGCNNRSTEKALAYGMLSIYSNDTVNGADKLQVIAFSNISEAEHTKLTRSLQNAEKLGGGRGIPTCYMSLGASASEKSEEPSRMKCLYMGELVLDDRTATITIRQLKGSDVVHISLLNRAANSSDSSPYKGGLGSMMSTSRGQQHQPCSQAVILSRGGFESTSAQALASHLLMGPRSVDVSAETATIFDYAKKLFDKDDPNNRELILLPDADKKLWLESLIRKHVSDAVMRNVLETYKISSEMDDAVYHAICR